MKAQSLNISDDANVLALVQALANLKTELAPLYPDIPVSPALSELNALIAYLGTQPLPQWATELTLDDVTYAGLGKLAMRYNCSPRIVLTAIMLCAAHDERS